MKNDLRSLFPDSIDTSQGWRADCPRCDRDTKKRLYWNTEKNVGCCFTADCGFYYEKGGVSEYRLRAWMTKQGIRYTAPLRKAEYEESAGGGILPKEYQLLDELEPNLRDSIFSYLTSRGLYEKSLRRMQVGYCNSGKHWGYIVFPVFDLEGKVVYWQGRRYKDRKPKFWNPKATNKKEIVYQLGGSAQTQRIVIVESIINALTLDGAASNSKTVIMALLGKNMSEWQRDRVLSYERSLREVIIALDPDATSTATDMAKRLAGFSFIVKLVKVPTGSDINTLGRLMAWQLINNAELYTGANYVESHSSANPRHAFAWAK